MNNLKAMLRDNPDMLDDIAKQVADEMADRSGLNDEYEIDVSAKEENDRGYPNTLADYDNLKNTDNEYQDTDPYHYIPQGDYPGYPDYNISDLPFGINSKGDTGKMGTSGCAGAAPVNALQPFIEYTDLKGMTDFEMMKNASDYFKGVKISTIGVTQIADYVNTVSHGQLTTTVMTDPKDAYEAVQNGATFVKLMGNSDLRFTEKLHWIAAMGVNPDGTLHVNTTNAVGAAAQLAGESDYTIETIDRHKWGDAYLVIDINDTYGGN